MAEVKEREPAVDPAGYDVDFYQWTNRQADLLRLKRFDQVDLPRLIEEIEDLGSEKRRALQSSYRVLILHLLKWTRQPEFRSRSWAATIVRERGNIEELEEENPSLAAIADELVARIYRRSVREAAAETGLADKVFPPQCPFTLAQLRDDEYLPD